MRASQWPESRAPRAGTLAGRLAPSLCGLCLLGGCGAIIEPGHRGLLFSPRRGGLQHEVLQPGYHRVGYYGRIDDFDVTFSTRKEDLQTNSSEGLTLDVRVVVIFRPIISELYELDTEIGPNFYDEVVGPEFRTAARGVFARHSYQELQRTNEKIEDEIEAELRRRISGRHVEVTSVTMESISFAPEIAAAIREKLVGEQEAARKKVALESEALRQKLSLEHEAEAAKLRAEAALVEKQHERAMAAEQAAIDRVRAETDAATRVTRAKAEATEISLLAKARAEEKRAETATLTPLAVMLHAYDALAKLGGSGTTVLLGDWSHVPSFLFPRLPGFQSTGMPVASVGHGDSR